MSYVRHKTRAFRDSGDIPELIRRRSEGRLKTYPSVEDARAWTCANDDRRQQILDYVISDIEKCTVGKYIPIDTLINTLLANKNADCGKLSDQVDELQRLLDMYSKLELSEEQKNSLTGMKADVKKAGENLESIKDKSAISSGECAAVKREQQGGVPCSALDQYDEKDLKAIIIKKDAEIIALKNQLAAKQAECDQYLSGKSPSQPTDRFKEVAKERDNLKRELQDSKHENQSLRSRINEPCVQEIEGLENEIRRLKSKGQLTADEEAEIIRKEIEVLKKYCAKLAAIQEENQALKRQLDQFKQGGGPSGKPCGSGPESELGSKIEKLNDVIAERDRLKERVKQLEKELLKFKNLPDDIETMKRKSQMLDSVSDECKKLRSSLENMKTVEQEISCLKKKANNADKLQNQLENKNEEIKCLAVCAKEADALRRERDNLRAKLNKLSGIETQYKQLQDKVKYLENVKCEREMYKMKYEQMLGLECDCEMLKAQVSKFKNVDHDRDSLVQQVHDCECCIAEQEEEIKKLISHIENMSRGNNEQQARMQKEINNMRNELNQKNNLIGSSEQQLSCVQDHLKKTIKGVSCETSCLRARIAELEERLGIKGKDTTSAPCGSRNIDSDGDEHYKEMLSDSKRAIVKISETLQNRMRNLETVDQDDLIRLNAENKTLKEISLETQKTSSKVDEDVIIKYEQANLKISSLQKQLTDCMDDVQRLTAETGTLKQISTETSSSEKKYEEQKRINDELQQQLKECKTKLEQLREAKSEVGRLSAENTTLRKLSVDLQNYSNEKVSDVSERLRKANLRISDLESELSIAREERDQLNNVVRTYKEGEVLGQAAQFGRQCDDLMEQLKKCKEELRKEIKQRQERDCAYKKSLRGDEEDPCASLRAQLAEEKKKAALAEANLKKLRDGDIKPKESDASDLQRISKTYEDRLEVANNAKKQQEQEIKSLHSKFNDSMGKLQSSHEEVLKAVDKEHEKEIENLRSELRTSKEAIAGLEKETKRRSIVRTPRKSTGCFKRPCASKETQENIPSPFECVCGSPFHQILQKIIRFGIETLTFDELNLLHNKTCEAANMQHKQPVSDRSVPFSSASIPMDDDRQRLIKRITALENDLVKKQKQTQEKVGALQLSIKMERQRLQDIKSLLDTEKNRNNELMVKIGAQSRTVANMQMERDSIIKQSTCNEDKLQCLIRQEQMQIQKLEQKLAKEKAAHKREMTSLFAELGRSPPRDFHVARCSCVHRSDNDNTDNSTYSDSHQKHQCKCKSSRSQRQTGLEELD